MASLRSSPKDIGNGLHRDKTDGPQHRLQTRWVTSRKAYTGSHLGLLLIRPCTRLDVGEADGDPGAVLFLEDVGSQSGTGLAQG
jgi:hypothetical protein